MPVKRAKTALTNRKAKIDAAVNKATRKTPAKKAPAKKNPYPKGSARAKLWARREADKKKGKK